MSKEIDKIVNKAMKDLQTKMPPLFFGDMKTEYQGQYIKNPQKNDDIKYFLIWAIHKHRHDDYKYTRDTAGQQEATARAKDVLYTMREELQRHLQKASDNASITPKEHLSIYDSTLRMMFDKMFDADLPAFCSLAIDQEDALTQTAAADVVVEPESDESAELISALQINPIVIVQQDIPATAQASAADVVVEHESDESAELISALLITPAAIAPQDIPTTSAAMARESVPASYPSIEALQAFKSTVAQSKLELSQEPQLGVCTSACDVDHDAFTAVMQATYGAIGEGAAGLIEIMGRISQVQLVTDVHSD